MVSNAVIRGSNLNLLGTRKPEVYAHTAMTDVVQLCRAKAAALGLAITGINELASSDGGAS